MRYYYEKPEYWNRDKGQIVAVKHPMFNRCTLIKENDTGIMIIQQHFNMTTKAMWWGSVDPWLVYDICKHPNFQEYYKSHACAPDENGFYYIVPVRTVMWSLRMKPLKKEFWEEPCFSQ